jgi:hypothetical protein
MPGYDVPTDSSDARERRESSTPVRPYPLVPRRTRRGMDPAEVLAKQRALVDSHPLGKQARAAALDLIWPFSREPAGLSKQIEIEDAAVDLLADPLWFDHACREAS